MHRLASNVIDVMRSQPFVLALVIINLIFVGFTLYTIREIGDATARKDQLLVDCLKGVR